MLLEVCGHFLLTVQYSLRRNCCIYNRRHRVNGLPISTTELSSVFIRFVYTLQPSIIMSGRTLLCPAWTRISHIIFSAISSLQIKRKWFVASAANAGGFLLDLFFFFFARANKKGESCSLCIILELANLRLDDFK